MRALTIAKRILTWCLLVASAVASFVLAVFLSSREIGASIVVANQAYGLLENWTLALIALSIGASVYLLRGFDGGGWSVSALVLVTTAGAASLLLLFGQYALWALAAVAAVLGPLLIRRKRRI